MMLHLIVAYADINDAESQTTVEAEQDAKPEGNEVHLHGGGLPRQRRSRWDIPPVVQSEPFSLLQAQVMALGCQVQAQQCQNDLRFTILARPFVEIVAGAVILWVVGTEQRLRVSRASKAFVVWKTKRSTKILAERMGLETKVVCAKAYMCIVGRNISAHYRTFARLRCGVVESKTLIDVGREYFQQHIPDQLWCIENFEIISQVYNFEGV